MAVNIRLSRGGSKKRPYYKIVVADARSPRDGRVIERIGSYNPLLAKDNPERVKLDVERAAHWIGVGAQPTDRVARFLDALGVKERAARNNPNKAVPGEKAKERADERATKAADAAEAAAAAAAAPAPVVVEEEPVVEAAVLEEAAVEEAAPAEESAVEEVASAEEAAPAEAVAAESDATGSVKSEATAEAVAEAVADETPADATAADATAMAEQAAEGGPAEEAAPVAVEDEAKAEG